MAHFISGLTNFCYFMPLKELQLTKQQYFLDWFKINRKESVWKQRVNVGVLKIINSWVAPKGWFISRSVDGR